MSSARTAARRKGVLGILLRSFTWSVYGFLYRSLRLSVRRVYRVGCSRIPISTPIEYSTLYYTVFALKPCESLTARTVYGPLTARKNTLIAEMPPGWATHLHASASPLARPSPCLRRPA